MKCYGEKLLHYEKSSVQSLSHVRLFATPSNCSMPGLPVYHQLRELTQTHVHESVMPSNHLILCYPLLFLPSIFPSIRIFSNELALCIRWAKYWPLPTQVMANSGLISFRIDWFDLFEVQGSLNSLRQHHNSKASVLHIRWPKY